MTEREARQLYVFLDGANDLLTEAGDRRRNRKLRRLGHELRFGSFSLQRAGRHPKRVRLALVEAPDDVELATVVGDGRGVNPEVLRELASVFHCFHVNCRMNEFAVGFLGFQP